MADREPDGAEGYYELVEEIDAKNKWELEHIVSAQLEFLPHDSAWLRATIALHKLMERADMDKREPPVTEIPPGEEAPF